MNSCSNCALISKQLRGNERLFSHTEFLFSDEDITRRQANLFLSDMFGESCKLVMNKDLFDRFAQRIDNFKNPYMLVYDEVDKKILFMRSMDSLVYFQDEILRIAGLSMQVKETIFEIPSIQNLYGPKYMEVLDNKIMILAYQSREVAYIVDSRSGALDSLVLTDSLISALLQMRGVYNVDVPGLKKYYEKFNLPYKVAEFSWRQNTSGNDFYLSIDMLIVNRDSVKIKHEITPEWYVFQMRYSPSTGERKYFPFQWWSDSIKVDGYPVRILDQMYRKTIGDSILISGADKFSTDTNTKIKMLVEMRKNEKGIFQFSGVKKELAIGPIFDFKDKHLNQPHHAYAYRLAEPYFYFHNSPVIYQMNTAKTYDIRQWNKKINWLMDLYQTQDKIQSLVQQGKQLVVYTVNSKTMEVISSTEIPTSYKNCEPRMNSQFVCYLDLDGRLLIYTLK
ncbi:MAG: hypothetical protein WC760_07000 [Bacteroidia bacterium]|jgi:hypothetical protein